MDDFNQEQENLLENALNNLPLAPLPSGFTERVLAAVQLNPRSAAVQSENSPLRFRLQFLDIALATFWSKALAVIWLSVLWWTGLLHLEWLPRLETDFSILNSFNVTNPTFLIYGAIILLLELSILGLVSLNVFGDREATG